MRVQIHSPSDTATDAIQWRDARIKHELGEAVRAAGHDLCYDDEDVNIWIHGIFTKNFLPKRKHVAWIISHPRGWLHLLDTRPEFRGVFDHVYCASRRLAEATRVRRVDASYLPCPAPLRPPVTATEDFEYDLCLIGNGATSKGRSLLRPLFERYKSVVVGTGWGSLSQHSVIVWSDIPTTINKARLYLHTAYPDMRVWGIMPDNVLDAAANTRALVLHDSVDASAELPLPSPVFSDTNELEERVAALLADEPKRAAWEALQREAAQAYVGYAKAAEMLCL